jgi:quinohemoprotein ethanol dehydrogenase
MSLGDAQGGGRTVKRPWRLRALAALSIGLVLCGPSAMSAIRTGMGAVDANRLDRATPSGDWLTYGGSNAETRFSPLDQINEKTISRLKPAWVVDLDTSRGQEATPLVIDGVMYTSTAWSKVMALDAATGRVLWKYDPQVIGGKAVHACCDVVNRGVAVWKGKVYVGTIDGRLIALDAATGKPVWSVVTVDQAKPYTITGAPRVFRDKVVIGNSGAELGVRGYITAYDTATGKKIWRFYTVPGNPADGPDHEASDDAMKIALPTWAGKWWKYGGGGTVWDSIVYDPELDQLLIGVGNGSPWNHHVRSDGKGDNLFLSSIVAVDPDTGKYKWHYQETPAKAGTLTAVQQMILTTLDLGHGPRKVVMQAPKNGFFFVIDRTNGKLLSAKPYVPVNWATGYDMTTGRPIEVPGARYATSRRSSDPVGHRRACLDADELQCRDPARLYPVDGGADRLWRRCRFRQSSRPLEHRTSSRRRPPAQGSGRGSKALASMYRGDADRMGSGQGQPEVWRQQYDSPGMAARSPTAGNLVFQGDAHGFFHAYAPNNGRELWSLEAHRGVLAGPMTYRSGASNMWR